MKTIAIDVRLIGRGRTGDEVVFRNLARELLKIDRENRYLLLTDRRDPAFLSDLSEQLGVSEHGNTSVVALRGENRFIWNLVAMPIFLLRNRVDLFHTQYILPLFVPKRTKVVAHIHDVSFRVFPRLIGWKDRLFLSLFIPHAMRRADLLVAPSVFTKEEIVSRYGVPEEKIAVVPNALSPEFLRTPTDIDLIKIRRKYGLPEKFFLSVGTLQPRKNLPLFLRAFACIRDRIPGVQVVLTGNRSAHHFDPEIDRSIRDVHLSSAVVFPGFIEDGDLSTVYRLAHGLVFPSRYEGFGIPLLEAFAAGVPVAVSDIAPFREVAGDAAIFFDPAGVADCAEALYTLSTDEKRRTLCRESGAERLKEYSWERSARVLFLRYQALLGQNTNH